jgi:hypothetical protein
MTRHCYAKRRYYVKLKKWKAHEDGGGTNFEATPSLGRAMYLNSKLRVKYRQIDVRGIGKPYVLEGSWK